ncbi:MAG: Ig domain-containing protein [Lachnospiraceae bacterium]|nr:Ig domain-containing protein [Lachnospiraceae bacterium]
MKKKVVSLALALLMCLSLIAVQEVDTKAAAASADAWRTAYEHKIYNGSGSFNQMYFGLNDFNEDGVPEMILSFIDYVGGAVTEDTTKLVNNTGVFTYKNGSVEKILDYDGEYVFRNGTNYVFAGRIGSDKAWKINIVSFNGLKGKLVTALSYEAGQDCTQDGNVISSAELTGILAKYGVKFEITESGNDAGKATISAAKATSLITHRLENTDPDPADPGVEEQTVIKYIKNYKVRIKAGMIMNIQDQTFNNNYITPLIAVTAGGAVLKKGTDFTVEFTDNKKVGTATVTVTGKGKYVGTAKKTFKIVKDANTRADISYTTYVQSYGWTPIVKDGTVSGTLGLSKRIEAIQIKLTVQDYEGSVVYSSYVQGAGWQAWKSNLATSGTVGKSKRLEGLKVKLTKKMAEHYDVYYRVYAQSYGWLGWAKNGAQSGTSLGKRVEAVQMQLVKKGGKAPGTTAKAYVTK